MNLPPDPAGVERQRRFAQCTREHGVDMPDPDAPSTPAGGPETTPGGPAFDEAVRACAQQVPGVVADPGGPKEAPNPK